MTLIFVIIGWVVFRAPDVATAFDIYAGMFGLQGWGLRPELVWAIRPSELSLLALGWALCLWPLLGQRRTMALSPGPRAVLMSVLLIAALSRMASQSYSPFLYFQF